MNTSTLPPLIIKKVEAFGVCLPMIKPVLMAGIELREAETMLVRIEAENGLVGWGETTSAPSHGGSTLEELLSTFNDSLKDRLPGKNALDLSGITQSLFPFVKKGKSAISAIDIALYDLVGRYLKVPVHVLIGGKQRDHAVPLWLIGNKSVEKDIIETGKMIDQGYRFFKLKLGVKSLADDILLTNTLRKEFGNDIQYCGDANMGMNLEQASTYVLGVKDANLSYFEQPLQKNAMDDLQKLIALSPVKIGLDESVTDMAAVMAHLPLGIAGVSLKTLKFGGISGLMAAGHACAALGLELNLAGKLAESSIASAALLHLSAALPHVRWGVSPSHLSLAQDIVQAPIQTINGLLPIPDTAGLGIEVDEDLVRKYQMK